jgi:hypothetical protein
MQRTATALMRGGLDLVTPPVAMPPGRLVAAVNYESDVAGYRRIGGYERFDGRPPPSAAPDAAEASARRAAIGEVPGTGPVRGVWVYGGDVYAFRDGPTSAGMYRASAAGWVPMTFGHVLFFTTGTASFSVGEVVAGGTSSATGTIQRISLRAGTFGGGDAEGYLVLRGVSGAFDPGEAITSATGAAVGTTFQAVEIANGGEYEFANHNFFGSLAGLRMYFTNGVNSAFEWDGDTLAPIYSGTSIGPVELAAYVKTTLGDFILTPDGGRVLAPTEFDLPVHVAEYSNHLFLTFRGGSIVHSGIGDPFDWRVISGAGEIGFGDEITGVLPEVSGSMVVFGRGKVSYLTGTSADDFVMRSVTEGSGALPRSMQDIGQPVFFDDGGLRRLDATDAFGDWRVGTMTQAVDPLVRSIQRAGVRPVASIKVKSRDQYRVYLGDGSGFNVFIGADPPETMPFLLPIVARCACAAEVTPQDGAERLFVGAEDGFVYEFDKGTSFDGAAVPAYLRLAWNSLGAPMQQKRFTKATLEFNAPTAVTVGVGYSVDYALPGGVGGPNGAAAVNAGDRGLRPIADYGSIDWTVPEQGLVEVWLDGLGRNLALTVVSDAADEEPHTLTSVTLNYTPRRVLR